MEGEIQKITETYNDYIAAFQTLDAKAILPFYHAPFMSISAREVHVLNTPGEIETSFARNMSILREGDYARTEMVKLYAKKMSKGLALISVCLERYTSAGEQIGGAGKTYTYTYTLRKVDEAWKIVVAMAHDAQAILEIS